MSLPRVSIVTPSYNQAQFLKETIESVLQQDYSNLEYIVVDGGSSDGSAEVIRRHANRLTWWVSEPDSGQPEALNKGFARATGEILGWLNSDDTLLAGAISRAVDALIREPDALLVYGDALLVDENSKVLAPFRSGEFELPTMVRTCVNHVVQPGSLFRRRALESAGPFNEDGYFFFDFEFVIRVGLAGRVIRLKDELATYRLHPDSKTVGGSIRKAHDHIRFYDDRLPGLNLPGEVRTVYPEGRARAYLNAAEYFYQGSDRTAARHSLVRGIRLYPRHASLRTLGIFVRTLIPSFTARLLRRLFRTGAASE